MMRFETHLHTTVGSYDGATTVNELVEWARRTNIQGFCITEHDYVWQAKELQHIQDQAGCLVIQGVEVSTNVGHVLAYGLREYVAGIHQIEVLRREIDKTNGILVLAHPFRSELNPYYQYGYRPSGLPDLEQILARPVFQYVDALEACNGSGVREEEIAVRRVAAALGLPVTGGSDAHSAPKLGLCLTELSRVVTSEMEFISAIKNGECDGIDLRTH